MFGKKKDNSQAVPVLGTESASPAADRDEALFGALQKSKNQKRRRRIITIVCIVVVLAIALTLTVVLLRRKVTRQFAVDEDVTSAQATVGSISTTVSGSGTLTNVDEETVTVPAGVEIEEVVVSANDVLEEGDIVATLNMASVMSAMADIQSQIDDIDEEISEAADDTVSGTITVGVAGRVKKLYADVGDNVVSVMAENGALALVSLDGYMSVEITTQALAAGDTVTVVRADGNELSGAVESVLEDTATVLVTDNGPEYGEEVTVKTTDGTQLGSGTLQIHSMLRVTGITGTVSNVRTAENRTVSASSVLYSLTDTSYSANYSALLQDRAQLEDTLMELFALYENGALLAPFSGSVSSVDYDEDTVSEQSETDVITLSPDVSVSITINVDESNILSLELEQTAQVTISSIGEDVFEGTLTEINKTATTSSGVTRYSAVITLDKTAQMLSGMSADVVIRIQGVDDAVLIPVDALHQTSAVSYVYTEYNTDTGEYGGMVEVTTGLSNSSYVEITSGLKEGDTVYYEESSSFGFGGMDFSSMGGDMSDFDFSSMGGGDMPSGGGGDMPSGGGGGGFSGGDMPSGGGGGGMPSGGGRG